MTKSRGELDRFQIGFQNEAGWLAVAVLWTVGRHWDPCPSTWLRLKDFSLTTFVPAGKCPRLVSSLENRARDTPTDLHHPETPAAKDLENEVLGSPWGGGRLDRGRVDLSEAIAQLIDHVSWSPGSHNQHPINRTQPAHL